MGRRKKPPEGSSGSGKRKESKREPSSAEARYRALFESLGDAVFCVGPDGRFQTLNRVAAEALGLRPEELVGKRISDFFPPEVAEHQLRKIFTVFETGEPLSDPEGETDIKGETRWYNTKLTPIKDRAGKVISVLGVGRDVTDYKLAREAKERLEEELRHAQKLEAVGRLAGGVAHDFNNLLTAILGYSQLLLKNLPKEDRAYRYAFEVARAAERASKLTRQLLAFSRKQVLDFTVCDLNAVIDDVKNMLDRVIGEDIELVTILASDLDHVRIDRNQIEQVLLNLAVNSRDAMPRGGTITIETRNVPLDEKTARKHADLEPGRYVLLSFSDTGEGMDPETRSHIFEPFFTTKEPGSGTGLGLSTAYGIIRQHHGHIEVESEPGAGTTFKIYFPPVEREEEKKTEEGGQLFSYRGTETLLVVEDEAGVRRFVCDALKSAGYEVLEASCPSEALEAFERKADVLRLVITDVVMPEMDGKSLVERLLRRRPGLKVLYMSGYADNEIVNHGVSHESGRFLQKPFSADTLGRAVRRILDE